MFQTEEKGLQPVWQWCSLLRCWLYIIKSVWLNYCDFPAKQQPQPQTMPEGLSTKKLALLNIGDPVNTSHYIKEYLIFYMQSLILWLFLIKYHGLERNSDELFYLENFWLFGCFKAHVYNLFQKHFTLKHILVKSIPIRKRFDFTLLWDSVCVRLTVFSLCTVWVTNLRMG